MNLQGSQFRTANDREYSNERHGRAPGAERGAPCPERRRLITELLEAIRQDENKGRTARLLHAPVWACLWLADLPKLREVVDGIKRNPFANCTELNGYFQQAKFLSLCEST